MLSDLSVTDLAPEAVIARRLVKKGNRAIPQVLVKWTHLPSTSATWEDLYVARSRFPSSLAWGQASSAGGEEMSRQQHKEGGIREAWTRKRVCCHLRVESGVGPAGQCYRLI